MSNDRFAIGLMCGTSLDGIDAAVVAVGEDTEPKYRVERFTTFPLASELRERLLAAQGPGVLSAMAFAELHRDVGEAFGVAARAVAGDLPIAFVASHGITIAHDADSSTTLQIGDAFRIREMMRGVPVAYDFRAADCAAGGTGAPLVPFVDRILFADGSEDRVALNLGGIANLTVLRRDGRMPIAFDSGPANMTIDGYVARRTNGAQRFDRDGALAASGNVDDALLATMLGDPYYAILPPKATGRERFGEAFLARYAAELDMLSLPDAVATLSALTAETVAAAIRINAPAGARVIVSGGGRHNTALFAMIAERLPGYTVVGSEAFGIDPDAKEALAYAVLGDALLRGVPAGMPSVTGASYPALLGAIAEGHLAR